jgi:hypothetical protein
MTRFRGDRQLGGRLTVTAAPRLTSCDRDDVGWMPQRGERHHAPGRAELARHEICICRL